MYFNRLKPIGLACVMLSVARMVQADFLPIALATNSYNYDVVIERSAPPPVVPATTASMDAGAENSGFSWYERGYNGDALATGLPAAGALLSSDAAADHQYRFAPSYTANNAVLLDAIITNATIILKVPQSCASLSFLSSSGGGGDTVVRYVVHHLDGTAESGSFVSVDWLRGFCPAWSANGCLNVATFAYDRVNSDYPRLYSSDVNLSNTISPLVSVDLQYINGIGHSATFALSGAAWAGSTFEPISIEGYNQDMVIEASAIHPGCLDPYTTATMENGTVNKRFTWYEQGYYTLQPASGLPAPGAMLTNQVAPDHCYVMAPSYTQNNAALIDLIVDSNSLTPLTPQRFSALSLLTAAGHGPATNLCVISHADGTAQTNAIISPDWFDSAPCAFAAGGRVSVNTKLVDSLNSGFPRLFSVDLSIANRSSEITNILFRFVGGLNDSHAVVFAVSGIAETAPPADGPRLSIHRGENGVISIASTVPGLLQSTATLKGTNTIWRDEGPISGVLTLTRSPFEPTCFYRVLPQ